MNTFWVPRNPYIHVLTILYFNEVSPDLLSFPLNYFYCQSLLKRFPDMSHSCWLALDVPQFVGISCLPPVLWLLEAAGAQVGGGAALANPGQTGLPSSREYSFPTIELRGGFVCTVDSS